MTPSTTRTRRTGGAALLGIAALVAATTTMPAAADDADRIIAQHQQHAKPAKEGSVRGVYDHLIALEEIGDAHGNRASGTPGYRASVRYVMKRLRKAGYEPTRQAFDFPFFEQTGPTTFTVAGEEPLVEDTDFALMTYSGSGTATGTITPVDLQLTTPNDSTSGCEASDFTGFPAGEIALIQRGSCSFGQKVMNAEAAGAVGAIVMNQGNEATPDRQDLFAGTLGAPVGIPAISVSYPFGQQLAADTPEATITTSTASEIRKTWNVIAETKQGNRKNVVMAGAHLDSVTEGNGINDNGSGSAALLETAEALAKAKKPNNKVRFAWWGAEEFGLLGSEHYVADLSENHRRQFRRIALYLNFDMVGSPNYMLGVYDGNDSLAPDDDSVPPEGSAAIERLFHRFFDKLGTGSVDTEFSGRSDYGPFIALNVPAGGLFTGAEGIKTEEEAELFGGTAGVAYDECYHAACDDLGNVRRAALRANTAAILHAVKRFARSTRSVNGDSTGHQPPPPEKTSRQAARAYDAHGHHAAAR